MGKLTNIRINIERWLFRRKISIAKKKDAQKMGEAIDKANRLTERNAKRFWVVKLDNSDYAVCTKQQVRDLFRKLGLRVNYMQLNEYIIHITKKSV